MAKLVFILSVWIFFLTPAFSADKSQNGPVEKVQTTPEYLTFGLIHFSPKLGDIDQNTKIILKAMSAAKAEGAQWLITPELALSGYYFRDVIGTDWGNLGENKSLETIQRYARLTNIGVLLSHIERDETDPKALYNTIFAVDNKGDIIAKHRKINTIPQSEDWANKGLTPTLVKLSDYQVGLLICADAWPNEPSQTLKERGAQLVISSANWGPGTYGPGNIWKKRSLEMGIPWIVNNRTGIDKSLDLRKAKSVVAVNGEHIVEHSSEENALVLVKWKKTQPNPTFDSYRTIQFE